MNLFFFSSFVVMLDFVTAVHKDVMIFERDVVMMDFEIFSFSRMLCFRININNKSLIFFNNLSPVLLVYASIS